MTRQLPEFSLVFASLVLLVACGGSGSSESPAPSPPSTPPSITISGSTSAFVGDAVDFVVTAPNGNPIADIEWQISGIPQQPLSDHTQAIGFDVPSSGSFDITAKT